jgi:quercetin 2,3-dioxygenase
MSSRSQSAQTAIANAVPPAAVEVLTRAQLGEIDKGWWKALYTASFVPATAAGHLAFGPLQLFSCDVVQPGGVFELHPHDNVEILTLVLEGSFEHKDTAGHHARARAGDAMLMSAGRGLQHQERAEVEGPTRVVTIWLTPRMKDGEPRYAVHRPEAGSGWHLIAGERGAPLRVDQDARVFLGRLASGETATFGVSPCRSAYLAVVQGEAAVNGKRLALPERMVAQAGELILTSPVDALVVLVEVGHA